METELCPLGPFCVGAHGLMPDPRTPEDIAGFSGLPEKEYLGFHIISSLYLQPSLVQSPGPSGQREQQWGSLLASRAGVLCASPLFCYSLSILLLSGFMYLLLYILCFSFLQ